MKPGIFRFFSGRIFPLAVENAVIFISGICYLCWTSANGLRTRSSFIYVSFYLVLAFYVTWAYHHIAYFLKTGLKPLDFLRKEKIVLIFAAFVTAGVFLTVVPDFRVLADEANLISTSRSLYLERTTEQALQSLHQNGKWIPLTMSVPVRSAVFPFLIALAHYLTGYRPENAFAVNGLLLYFILCMVGVGFRRLYGASAACAAILLTVSQPVVSLAATSAHYDLFFLACCSAFLLTMYRFVKDGSTLAFDMFWMNLLLLALSRHEAPVYAFVPFAVLVLFRRIRLRHFLESSAFALTPVFMSIQVWHTVISYHAFANPNGKSISLFSWQYFVRQNGVFLRSLSDLRFFIPTSNIADILGIAGLVYFAVKLCRPGSMDKDQRAAVCTAAALVLSVWVLFTSFYWGSLDNTASWRFYVFPLAFLSVTAALFLCSAVPAFFRLAVLWAVAAASLFLYHPVAMKNQMLLTQTVWNENHAVYRYFNKMKDSDFIVITDSQEKRYNIYDYGVVSVLYANSHKSQLLGMLKRKAVKRLFVLQHYKGGKSSRLRLDKSFTTVLIYEMQSAPGRGIRIYSVDR